MHKEGEAAKQMGKKDCTDKKKLVTLQPTMGTRTSSPATDAGEGARVPRQSSEITVSYIEADSVSVGALARHRCGRGRPRVPGKTVK